MATVKPIPEGYHNVTPYLFVRARPARSISTRTSSARRKSCACRDRTARIMHAELKIGDSIVMLADENPQTGMMSPQTIGGFSVQPARLC